MSKVWLKLNRIGRGMKLLFIPYAEGVYVPFTLHQYLSHEVEAVVKTGRVDLSQEVVRKREMLIKPMFFLDLELLSEIYQKVLK